MKKNGCRYLAFVDYLGTERLYRNADLQLDAIVDRRQELEHAIQILLQPFIAAKEIEIGVFSDTVLIAGPSLPRVLHCSSLLMKFVLEKTINRANRIDCRLLRGGLAKGVELRTTYLRPGPRVHVVPFFDSSLAFSYELGGVRKGSRLFLSDTVGDEDLGNLKEFVFKWQYLSGVGSPAVGIHEFLWPGYVYKEEPAALASLVERAFAQWREYVRDFPGTREDYKATLYHFDETIKCMLRSLIPLRDFPYGVEAIKRCAHVILPREADYMEDCDIRYIWGFWFQALLVLCTSKLVAEHDSAILLTKKELVRRGYLDNFMAESNYPDYKALKELFQSDLWRANRGTDESEVPPGFTPQL